jgi:uncharacterized membrane protein
VVAAFQDEKAADEALKELKTLKREKLIRIENAAVIRKDEKGKLHIKETADMGGAKGAVLGGVAGATIGLIAGPLLVVPAAVGALVGGLTAKLRDSGFSDERLETLGEGLTPGSSAIVAVIEHKWVAEVQKELEEAGADLVTAELQADIASQLEAGHEVAYTALATQEGFAASRVAGGEDEVEGSSVVVTDDAVVGEAARSSLPTTPWLASSLWPPRTASPCDARQPPTKALSSKRQPPLKKELSTVWP